MSLAAIGAALQIAGAARGMTSSRGTPHVSSLQKADGTPYASWQEVLRNRGTPGAITTQAQRNEDLQREFAQMGIRWRVEDAKAAGLHPLYALGAQPIPVTPTQVFGEGGGGSMERGASVSQFGSALMGLSMLAGQAEKDHAMAEYYRALASKLRQDGASAAPALGDASGYVSGDGEFVHQGTQFNPATGAVSVSPFFDRRRIVPSQSVAANSMAPSEEASTGPAWKRWKLNNEGLTMLLPAANSVSEALESMSESKVILGAVIGKNVKEQGAKWLVEFTREMGSGFFGGN